MQTTYTLGQKQPQVLVAAQALPLWLIKAYEEKYRRDGVVPVRGRGAAAAAAVADACGLCAAVYADDKDSLWVACDTCNKWFHCACVGIEQVWEIFAVCAALCAAVFAVSVME